MPLAGCSEAAVAALLALQDIQIAEEERLEEWLKDPLNSHYNDDQIAAAKKAEDARREALSDWPEGLPVPFRPGHGADVSRSYGPDEATAAWKDATRAEAEDYGKKLVEDGMELVDTKHYEDAATGFEADEWY
jgi:hypothetical protein